MTLTAYVLMPFSDPFSFVYEHGIRQAFGDVNLSVRRADDHVSLQVEKIHEVIADIRAADFCVFDITGHNPNVLWELGYARAIEKHVFVLSQTTVDLPFNIRGLDVITYGCSVNGLKQLKDTLINKLRGALPEIRAFRTTLAFDPEIVKLHETVSKALARIPIDSVVRNLARNELTRLAQKLAALPHEFELRNKRPNSEIIDYFEDCLEQLNSTDSRFDAVTNVKFWKEISENGHNEKYLLANRHAAAVGARIRRVFIIDAARCAEDSKRIRDPELRDMLSRYHEVTTGEFSGSIETRLFFSRQYTRDCNTYDNFGILSRADERLLMQPIYKPDGAMEKTLFTYCNVSVDAKNATHRSSVEKCEMKFESVFQRGELLGEEHIQAPEAAEKAPMILSN